jgi:anti-sigma regulatory factor (Ser/Thr protein kinase)
METIEIEIPPRSVYVGVVRLALASLARAGGMDEDAVDDLKIAVSEACTNAVQSNEQAGGDPPVVVSWRVEGDHAVVEVADRGTLYDSRDAGDSLDNPSGRVAMSATLLGSLVEDFQLVPRADGGTCARFTVPLA